MFVAQEQGTGDTSRARAFGREAGYMPTLDVSQCPYPFAEPDLRMAWLDGFSEGRVCYRQRHDIPLSGVGNILN